MSDRLTPLFLGSSASPSAVCSRIDMDMSAFRYPSARALTVSHELDSVEEHAYDQWDYLPSGMLVMRRPWAFALPVFDTGGEFMPGRQNNPGASERRPHSSLENWAKPNSP